MRKAQYLAILAAFILSRESIGAQEFPTFGGAAYRDLLRAAFSQIERFAGFLAPSKIRFLADGSGDGGSSDGGSSSGDGGSSSDGGAAGAAGAAGAGAGDSGGSTGDGTGSTGDSSGSTGDGTGSTGDGTGSASDSDGASASDSASASDAAAASATSDAAASAATDAAAATTTTTTTNDDEAAPATDNNAPPSDPNTVTEAPTTDPTTITVTPELAAIMAIPTTDPRDGSGPEVFTGPGVPDVADVTTIPPGGFVPPGPPVNVEIHAVIISAAQSPWDAIQRAPGIGNVTVVGGIVALGKTPIPGEIPGGGPQPDWLRLIPDLRLLNGSMIPPVVPNIIDIRWLNCPIKVEERNP
jgi:hypothetical protein